MAKEPVHVLVAGAAGPIGLALIPKIAAGDMLGPSQPVFLHMLDIESAAEKLTGVTTMLADADDLPLLAGVVATTNVVQACTGVNVVIMVDGFPGEKGKEERDRLSRILLHCDLPSALDQHVLVAKPEANIHASTLTAYAPSIPEKNITFLTRLEHDRALGQISNRLGVQVSDVKNVIVWGDLSSTPYVDVSHATVRTPSGEKLVSELLEDNAWLDEEFKTNVPQHGAASAIIKPKKIPTALSYASAICYHISDWVLGTPEGTFVPMGVISDGSYNVPAGRIYSFPVTCRNGDWTVVEALEAAVPNVETSAEGSPIPAGAAQVPEKSTCRKFLDKIKSLKGLTRCFKVCGCCVSAAGCVYKTIDETDSCNCF